MFTSIVGIGVANILMAFAGRVAAQSLSDRHRLGAAWLLILLLTYMGMFWNSTLLMGRDDWSYTLFLFVIVGPIVLLFASSMMTRILSNEAEQQSAAYDRTAISRFFVLYALVHAWFIGMDYLLGIAWGLATLISIGLLVSAASLALVNSMRLVWVYTAVILALTLADIYLR